jgi:hypothetical protein
VHIVDGDLLGSIFVPVLTPITTIAFKFREDILRLCFSPCRRVAAPSKPFSSCQRGDEQVQPPHSPGAVMKEVLGLGKIRPDYIGGLASEFRFKVVGYFVELATKFVQSRPGSIRLDAPGAMPLCII